MIDFQFSNHLNLLYFPWIGFRFGKRWLIFEYSKANPHKRTIFIVKSYTIDNTYSNLQKTFILKNKLIYYILNRNNRKDNK